MHSGSVILRVLDNKLNCYLSVSILTGLFSDKNWVSNIECKFREFVSRRKENTWNIVETISRILSTEGPSCDYAIHIVLTECIPPHAPPTHYNKATIYLTSSLHPSSWLNMFLETMFHTFKFSFTKNINNWIFFHNFTKINQCSREL